MRKRNRTKTVLGIIVGIFVFAFALTDFIYVLKYSNSNPGVIATSTPRPTTVADNFDAKKTVTIKNVTATADEVTVEYDPIEGAAGYLVSIRAEADDEWIVESSADTKLTFAADSKTVYEIKVCAISNSGISGASSEVASVKTDANGLSVNLSSSDVTSITATWDAVFKLATYLVEYKETGNVEWIQLSTDDTEITINGLKKNTSYDFRVTSTTKDSGEVMVSPIKTSTTQSTGFVDPFANIYGTLHVGTKQKSVLITTTEGCLGAKVWAEYDTKLYSDVDLTKVVCSVTGGTKLKITKDEDGVYVHSSSNNKWSVHVTGNTYSGWIEGCSLLVDLQDIFRSQDNIYSIQYNRTNSYASIFTCGGSAKRVDTTSAANTRYAPLNAISGTVSLNMGNYNVIKDVTGLILPNYGSKNQMPVIWDLALELITCQRNALENGYTLLIYEGYRPNATSRFVYGSMTEAGYLTYTQNGITLANGFLNTNLTAANYIAFNSNHNKGIAVDITIMKFTTVDTLGSEVSMQTKMHTLDFRANMRYNTSEANLLKIIMMTNTGLVALRGKQEWWHFELSTDVSKYPGVNKYIFSDYGI